MDNLRSWRLRDPIFLARVRIASGLVLFIYVLTHFINHSIGLWSFELMEAVSGYFRLFWRFPPFSIILYGALLAHVVLALHLLFKKRSLSMTVREGLQTILGLAIPFLMVVHLLATRMASSVFGLNDNYAYVVLSTFVQSPIAGYINVTGLVVVWIHGCIGIHSWLRLKPWFQGILPASALMFATLLPVLAITGYLSAGRELILLSDDGEWLLAYLENLNLLNSNLGRIIAERAVNFRYGFAAVLIAVVVLRFARYLKNRRSNQVRIDYMDGPVIRHPVGTNLLEISHIHGVPHASVCGGRGRCSTCRVRIVETELQQEQPDEGEQKVLERIGAGSGIRLACQLVPKGKMRVVRLMPVDATMADVGKLPNQASGVEQVVAILFADIREFTARSETKLPFDVVYLVNQFSQAMGVAIEQAGGQVDKFLGDGLMALFGVNSTPQEGCRAALKAAAEMQIALDSLNLKLAGDLDEPLRVGIGIHAGPVVLGDMGYGASRGLTAIGDTVNTASRLEAATKEQGVTLCISATVAELAKSRFDDASRQQISLRGKKNKLPIYALNLVDLTEHPEY